MGKTRKHQATYDYLHGREDRVKHVPRLLNGVRRYFNRVNFLKWDMSRMLWYRHKRRNG